jgi:signal transduction histidine kinase
LGVLAIDLLLPDISKFLGNLKVTPKGQVFIMERDGQLVGSSGNHPILHKVNDKVERYTVLNSPDPLIRAIATELKKRYKNFSAISDNEELNISFNRQRYFSQVTPWQDEYGLNWLVVVSVPESDFMGQINTNTRMTILLCLGALGLATVSGIYTAHWITQPILRLSQATQAIADGELNQTVKETSVNELSILARSFNRMAQQLRDSFIALEKTNFQLEQTNEGLEVRVVQRTEELSQALHDLQETQTQLVQTEKMSSLGQMVAGIAHEINNPANFIHGNLECAGNYLEDLLETLKLYQKYYPTPTDEIQHHVEAADIDFLMEDLPKMLNSMQEGTRRIREIVLSLRNFSRLDEATMKQVDIHQGIDSTLLILGHRLKANSGHPEIEVIKDYGKIPLVECYAGQLNQVFMNLLSNAIDALEENHKHPGTITISTYTNNAQQVIVKIADNGAGMASDIQSKIFDPFFTTKAVGRGTGLGLSISYQIIVSLHGGLLNCSSIQGKGTEFTICIPFRTASIAIQTINSHI